MDKEELKNIIKHNYQFENDIDVKSIEHIKIGNNALTKMINKENILEKYEIQGPELSRIRSKGHGFVDKETSRRMIDEILQNIEKNSNVVNLKNTWEENDKLKLISAYGTFALYLDYPINFDIALSKNYQMELIGHFGKHLFETEERFTSEHINVLYDGMLYISRIQTNKITPNSVFGQVTRDFLKNIFTNLNELQRLDGMVPNPIQKDYFFICIDKLSYDQISNQQFLHFEHHDNLFILFSNENYEDDVYNFICDILPYFREFYITKSTQSKLDDIWFSLSNSYYEIQDLIYKLINAKYPKYLTTLKTKKQLKKEILNISFKLYQIETICISFPKIIDSTKDKLLSHSFTRHLHYLIDKDELNMYNTDSLIKILNFLDSELHTFESSHSKITSTLVGVIFGSLLTLIISFI